MKRQLSIVFALAILNSFTACGSKNESLSDSSLGSNIVISSENISESMTEALTQTDSIKTEITEQPTTKVPPTKESITEKLTETITKAENTGIENSDDYVNAIGKQIEITDIFKMASEYIGAIDGTSFMYNGNKFEVYKFDESSVLLNDGADGDVTLNISGFGEYSTNSTVNGKFMMIYDTNDAAVIQAFINVQ